MDPNCERAQCLRVGVHPCSNTHLSVAGARKWHSSLAAKVNVPAGSWLQIAVHDFAAAAQFNRFSRAARFWAVPHREPLLCHTVAIQCDDTKRGIIHRNWRRAIRSTVDGSHMKGHKRIKRRHTRGFHQRGVLPAVRGRAAKHHTSCHSCGTGQRQSIVQVYMRTTAHRFNVQVAKADEPHLICRKRHREFIR